MWYKLFDWCAMPVTVMATLYVMLHGKFTPKIFIVMAPVIIVNEIAKTLSYKRAFKEAGDMAAKTFGEIWEKIYEANHGTSEEQKG